MPRRQVSKKHTRLDSTSSARRVTGIIELTRKATGYLPWPYSAEASKGKPMEDIEIFPEKLNGALNGDQVEVELLSMHASPVGRARPRGRVVKVIERAKTQFVATLRQAQGKLMAIPADIKFYRPIKISPGGGLRNPQEGDKVLVRLISFDGEEAMGTIEQVLGKAGEHRVEMNAIVLDHGFSTSFPLAVEREAAELEKNHAAIIAAELPKRKDFRSLTTMTIDPADAKDFDDALSVRELADGTYEVGVHIADATHFCVPGTAIDDEAVKRGTSVYLVDATIPMLPHSLSGGIASLKEGEERLAFSALFTLDKNARVLSRMFTKSVIKSDKRFTYEEAQEILDTLGEGPAQSPLTPLGAAQPGFAPALQTLWSLAKQLRARREKEGAIDFGDNEVRFVLDPSGKPLKVIRKERIDTNWLIEEFMLLCNREVSEHVSKLAEKVPEKNYIFLYRIHDEPKADRIEVATFVRAVGYDFAHNKKKPSAKDIQKLLKDIGGKPEEHLIRTATLRSMAKAIYSTKNIGHFGLSFKYYTQFTSPIRRYPDMLAHRILASHLSGNPITRREYVDLEKRCLRASEQEAKAVDAERESIRYKLVEYMQDKIGKTFDAVISGVTDWGLYVEEKETSAEGLVRVRSLGNDFYNYSQKEYALVGQKTKKKFTLGDRVKVKLVAADLASRQLDFELTG